MSNENQNSKTVRKRDTSSLSVRDLNCRILNREAKETELHSLNKGINLYFRKVEMRKRVPRQEFQEGAACLLSQQFAQ